VVNAGLLPRRDIAFRLCKKVIGTSTAGDIFRARGRERAEEADRQTWCRGTTPPSPAAPSRHCLSQRPGCSRTRAYVFSVFWFTSDLSAPGRPLSMVP
jgi:hypothetical protein